MASLSWDKLNSFTGNIICFKGGIDRDDVCSLRGESELFTTIIGGFLNFNYFVSILTDILLGE